MRLSTLLVLLVAAATPAEAQESCLAQVKFPKVGRWAEYKAVYDKKEPYTIRYAVIGSEKRGGTAMKWVEMRMVGNKKDRNMIYQMLVPGSPAEMGNVQEVVFKPGDQQAMKMTGMMMKMIRGQLEQHSFLSEVCKDVTLIGLERVTVPAGRFMTRHFRSAKYGADSWVAPGVSFSLVKTVGENHRMELVAQGGGAKSSITEQPQEMPGMGSAPRN
jgi:hypothetical protein